MLTSNSLILARPYNMLVFTSHIALNFAVEVLGFFSMYSTNHSRFLSSHLLRFQLSPARKVCIIRGIGYRVQLFNNHYNLLTQCFKPNVCKYEADNRLESSFCKEVLTSNEETDWNAINTHEFPHVRYLSLRVGHSAHLYFPVPHYIGIKILKKDRKLVVYGFSQAQVSTFTQFIYSWRPPSVYTGRGIRYKKTRHRRKLGKKDIRKGRFF